MKRTRALLYAGAVLITVVVIYCAVLRSLPLLEYRDGVVVVADFAYYLLVGRVFWNGEPGTIYEPESLMLALSVETGLQFTGVMPVAITPMFLAVLLPFLPISHLGLDLATASWLAVSWLVLLAGISKLSAMVRMGRADRLWRSAVVLLAIGLASSAFLRTTALGQTTSFALGLLLLLRVRLQVSESRSADPRRVDWLTAIFAVVVSLKAHYMVLAFLLLIIWRRWCTAVAGIALALFICLLLTPKLGFLWPLSYLESYRLFSADALPALVQSAFGFNGMNIFRTATSEYLSTKAAIAISQGALWLGFIAALLLGVTVRNSVAGRDLAIGVFLGAYLLFTPYAGAYEDLLLIYLALLPLCAAAAAGCQPGRYNTPVAALLLLLSINYLALLECGVSPTVLYLFKGLFVVVVLRSLYVQHRETERAEAAA